jgi:hypothetical protein
MAQEYTNLFHSKGIKLHPNWDFWFENIPSGIPVLQVSEVEADFKFDRSPMVLGGEKIKCSFRNKMEKQ